MRTKISIWLPCTDAGRCFWLGLRAAILAASAVLFLAGISCCSKATKPTPAHSRLLVAFRRPVPNVWGFYVYDTESDTVIDSITTCGPGYISANPETPYAAISCMDDSCYRFFETNHFTAVGQNCEMDDAYPVPVDGLIVGFRSLFHVYFNEVILATLPGGEALFQDTLFTQAEIESMHVIFMEFEKVNHRAGLVYGTVSYGQGQTERQDLIAYDYRHRRRQGPWRVNLFNEDSTTGYVSRSFDVHPDGRRVYFVTSVQEGPRLVCYDIVNQSVLFLARAYTSIDYAQVTPDGRYVCLSVPRGVNMPSLYNNIAVYDADDGELRAEIPLDTLWRAPWFPPYPMQMRLVPGLDKGYLAEGAYMGWVPGGRVAVINMKTFRVEKILDKEFGGSGTYFSMEVVPVQ